MAVVVVAAAAVQEKAGVWENGRRQKKGFSTLVLMGG